VRSARGRRIEVSFGQPVTIAGVTVAPGDCVVGDGSVLVVVTAAEVLDRRYESLLEVNR
jgi:regulator of RNase E activity RraA